MLIATADSIIYTADAIVPTADGRAYTVWAVITPTQTPNWTNVL
jgi:hypothetical protein